MTLNKNEFLAWIEDRYSVEDRHYCEQLLHNHECVSNPTTILEMLNSHPLPAPTPLPVMCAPAAVRQIPTAPFGSWRYNT